MHQLRHHQFLILKENMAEVKTIVDQVREIIDADDLGQLDIPNAATASALVASTRSFGPNLDVDPTSSASLSSTSSSSSSSSPSFTLLAGRKHFNPIDRGKFIAWTNDVEKLLSNFDPSDNHKMDPLVCLIEKFQMLQDGPIEFTEVARNARSLLETWSHQGAFDDANQDDEQQVKSRHKKALLKQAEEAELEASLLSSMMFFEDEEFDVQRHTEEMVRWALEEKNRVESSYAYQIVRRRAAERLIKQKVVLWARSRQQFRDRVEEITVFGNTADMLMDNLIKSAQHKPQHHVLGRTMSTFMRRSTMSIGLGAIGNGPCIYFKDLMGFSKHVAIFDVDNAIRSIDDIMIHRRLLLERSALKFQLAYRRWKENGGRVPDGSAQHRNTIVDLVNQLKKQVKDKKQTKKAGAISEATTGDASRAGTGHSKKRMLHKVPTPNKSADKNLNRSTPKSRKGAKSDPVTPSSKPSSSASSRRMVLRSEPNNLRGNRASNKEEGSTKNLSQSDSDKGSSSSLDSEEERELMRKFKDATNLLETMPQPDACASEFAQDATVPAAAPEQQDHKSKSANDEDPLAAAARAIALSASRLSKINPRKSQTGFNWDNGVEQTNQTMEGPVHSDPELKPDQPLSSSSPTNELPTTKPEHISPAAAAGATTITTPARTPRSTVTKPEWESWSPPHSASSNSLRTGGSMTPALGRRDSAAKDPSALNPDQNVRDEMKVLPSQTPSTLGTPDDEEVNGAAQRSTSSSSIQMPRMLSIIQKLQLEHEKEQLLEQQRLKRVHEHEQSLRLAKQRNSVSYKQISQPFGLLQADLFVKATPAVVVPDKKPEVKAPNPSTPRVRKSTVKDMELLDLLANSTSKPPPFLSLAALQNVSTRSDFHSMKLLLPNSDDSESFSSSDSDLTSDPTTNASDSTSKPSPNKHSRHWVRMSGSFDALRKQMKSREPAPTDASEDPNPVEPSLDEAAPVEEHVLDEPEPAIAAIGTSHSSYTRSSLSLASKPLESLLETDDNEIPKQPEEATTTTTKAESHPRSRRKIKEPSWNNMKDVIYRTPKKPASPSSSPRATVSPHKRSSRTPVRPMGKKPAMKSRRKRSSTIQQVEQNVKRRVGAKKPTRGRHERATTLPVIATASRPMSKAKTTSSTTSVPTTPPKKKSCVIIIPVVRHESQKSLDRAAPNDDDVDKKEKEQDNEQDKVGDEGHEEEEEDVDDVDDEEAQEEEEEEQEEDEDNDENQKGGDEDEEDDDSERDALADLLEPTGSNGRSGVGFTRINLDALAVLKSKRDRSKKPIQVSDSGATASDAMDSATANKSDETQEPSAVVDGFDLQQLDLKEVVRSNQTTTMRVKTRKGQVPDNEFLASVGALEPAVGRTRTGRKNKRLRRQQLSLTTETEQKRKELEFQRLRSIYIGLLQCKSSF